MKKDEFLQHYGVLGMRWGKRRSRSVAGISIKRKASEEHLTAKSLKRKKAKELSNDEIQKTLNRLNLEKQFRDSKRTQGRKLVQEVLLNSGKKVLTAITIAAMMNVAKQVLGPSLGIK